MELDEFDDPDDDTAAEAEYRDRLGRAYHDGFGARSMDQIPYYEDLNLDQAFEQGFIEGQQQRRQEHQHQNSIEREKREQQYRLRHEQHRQRWEQSQAERTRGKAMNLSEIRQVLETSNQTEANEHLRDGWRLLDQHHHDGKTVYVLGELDPELGEVKEVKRLGLPRLPSFGSTTKAPGVNEYLAAGWKLDGNVYHLDGVEHILVWRQAGEPVHPEPVKIESDIF